MPPNDQFDGVMDAIDASYDNEVNKLARKMETLEQKIKAGLDPELYQGWRIRSRLKPGKKVIKITVISNDKIKIRNRRDLKEYMLDHDKISMLDFEHMLFAYQTKWAKPWKHHFRIHRPIAIPDSFNGIPIKDIPHKAYFYDGRTPLLDKNGDMFWPADKIREDNSLDGLSKDTFEVQDTCDGKIVISKEREAKSFKIAAQRSWLLIGRKERRSSGNFEFPKRDGSKSIDEDCRYTTLYPNWQAHLSTEIAESPKFNPDMHPLGSTCDHSSRQWLSEKDSGNAETKVVQSFQKPIVSSSIFCMSKYHPGWPEDRWAAISDNFHTEKEFNKFVDFKGMDTVYDSDIENRLIGKSFNMPLVSLNPKYKDAIYAMQNIYYTGAYQAYRYVV